MTFRLREEHAETIESLQTNHDTELDSIERKYQDEIARLKLLLEEVLYIYIYIYSLMFVISIVYKIITLSDIATDSKSSDAWSRGRYEGNQQHES